MPATLSASIKTMLIYTLLFGECLPGEETIELSFMFVGHTKYLPDSHFELNNNNKKKNSVVPRSVSFLPEVSVVVKTHQ